MSQFTSTMILWAILGFQSTRENKAIALPDIKTHRAVKFTLLSSLDGLRKIF